MQKMSYGHLAKHFRGCHLVGELGPHSMQRWISSARFSALATCRSNPHHLRLAHPNLTEFLSIRVSIAGTGSMR